MNPVGKINCQSTFNLEEAEELFPLIYRITQKYRERVQALIDRMDNLNYESEERVSEIEKEIGDTIEVWKGKMCKLGVIPKGLWVVDFDNSKGYFCWKYPESKIEYFHEYGQAVGSRVLLSSLNSENFASMATSGR